MPYGPCSKCGLTNYPSSMGGYFICPSCDCGNPLYSNQTISEFVGFPDDKIIERTKSPRYASQEQVMEAMDIVLKKHAGLFKRLALLEQLEKGIIPSRLYRGRCKPRRNWANERYE